ncbi:hypothetical protein [Cryobacterium sp. TMT2-42-4]|uniref:hypothetical protein n=1 Tax=Cryobacterium sp. TMT2-42-4 TaxID=1259255 RepID=UPI00141BBBF5|nr:hypothetical protein [Cryobacterium sp. TMT2-42-4]
MSTRAEALSGSDFDPGYIISDQKFFDSGSMSESQIQSFLNSKVATCRTGYTCLKDYRVSTFTRAAVEPGHCKAYIGAENELASRIIFKTAQACGINPQTLLVLLEKETGLVGATSPTDGTYRKAMGYGCPDTSVCDSAFYGLYNQIYKAAWQFRQYTNYPARQYRIGSISVGYHPNSSCGSSTVKIFNQATANLYNYTPYQPNTASLSNLGGTGDACSSYGNRNFWAFFTNWFGSTQSPGPDAIQRAYNAQGGAAGPLGAPTSDVLTVTANGGGFGRVFQNGSIFWNTNTGARIMSGAIRDYYFTVGGETGYLAWPMTDVLSVAANGGGYGQGFQGGSLYSSASGGTRSVFGDIRREYHTRQGETGILGWPTTDRMAVAENGGGFGQAFQNGSIYWPNGGRARSVYREIRGTYFTVGGEKGALGWPTSDLLHPSANGGGLGQAFQKGSIYWSAGRGAFAVTGGIRNFYFTQAGEAGALGWPIAAEICGLADGGCSQAFQNGTIYWSSADGGRIGSPEIEAVYNGLGGATGALGSRTSGLIKVSANGGGLGQAFQKGSIYWSAGRGAFAVTGGIRNFYFTQAGEAGALGWPIAAEICGLADGGCSQAFQNGTINWSSAGGGRTIQ